VDHIRGLLSDEPDPSDPLAAPIPPESDGNRHLPVPNREHPWGRDHVGELIRGDCPSDHLLLEEHVRLCVVLCCGVVIWGGGVWWVVGRSPH
jgi:hypothetical protein